MRAARLLHLLLILQNRGRQTSASLARELGVARRTILRDVDAMLEAGLPLLVHRGVGGGIELGFNYRTRLTGLAADEAEALGVLLARPAPELEPLGMSDAARRAVNKLVESLPDRVRPRVLEAQARFGAAQPAVGPVDPADDEATTRADGAAADPRIAALALAVREGRVVRIAARSAAPREVHPVALRIGPADDWELVDARASHSPIARAEWADINISARTFS